MQTVLTKYFSAMPDVYGTLTPFGLASLSHGQTNDSREPE